MEIKSICVYCGSSPGKSAEYTRAAKALGGEIARRGLTLVYGGAGVGLMGEVARAALDAEGRVVGVIPEILVHQEIASKKAIELRVAKNMHERKALMAELSDAFIALPGGFGTLEEIFEALTWLQLGIHTKPCGLLNTLGYYNGLLNFLDHAVEELFIYQPHRGQILVAEEPSALLEQVTAYQPEHLDKAAWVREMSGRTYQISAE